MSKGKDKWSGINGSWGQKELIPGCEAVSN